MSKFQYEYPRARMIFRLICTAAALGLFSNCWAADDWPMWGHDPSRNMVCTHRGLFTSLDPGKARDDGTIDPATLSKNVKWVAKLGTQTYGNPVCASGNVLVGTNNGWPHFRPDLVGDYGVLACFDTAGQARWFLFSPKLAAGKVSDWEQVGLCSSATIDGNRVYVVTNRCEVLCLDLNGMANGNDGPFRNEGQYIAGPGNPPVSVGDKDADIIWRYDLRDELGVFPHNMTSSSVLVVGERLYVTTSNAVDWSDRRIPSPDAPALICLDKKSGELLGQERSGICRRLFLSNWSSPAFATIRQKPMVIFGAGDGFCYAFDPQPDADGTLREIWRCDCNPPGRRISDGKPVKHTSPQGPSEIIATPVVFNEHVYVAVGQEPEAGEGVGCLNCIDATKTGDITTTGNIWANDKVGRSISTIAADDGLVYFAEFSGIVRCLDAQTGQEFWNHDTESHIWGSTFLSDAKVYVGNENGTLTILAAGKQKKVIATIDFKDPIYSTPIVADGIMYLATSSNLYAIQGDSR